MAVTGPCGCNGSPHYFGPGCVGYVAKGEPFRRAKEKARYMADQLWEDGYKQGHFLVDSVIAELIQTAPEQTLDALCKVLDPDASQSS